MTRARGTDAKSAILYITLVAGFAGTISFNTVHFLSEQFGWRGGFQIIGSFLTVIVAPMLYFGSAREKMPKSIENPGNVRKSVFLRNPVLWVTGLALAAIGLIHGTIIHHFLPILSEKQTEK